MNRTLTRSLAAITPVILLSSVVLFGCDKPETSADTKSTETTNAAAAPASAAGNVNANVNPNAAATPLVDSELSTPADFEEETEKAITSKNYTAELATLESEIDKE
jgi:hypothetical protein